MGIIEVKYYIRISYSSNGYSSNSYGMFHRNSMHSKLKISMGQQVVIFDYAVKVGGIFLFFE